MLAKLLGTSTGIHTIVLARLQMIGSVFVGAAAAIDWSQLLTLAQAPSFDWGMFFRVAGTLFGHGLVLELVRRFKATDVGAS